MLPESALQLFATQQGVLGDHQLRLHEPQKAIRRKVYEHSEVERVTPRVIRHRAAPASTEQSLMISLLDAGGDGYIWGKCAVSHWGFSRFRRLPAHVAIERRRVRGDRIGQLHRVRSLDPRDVTTHLGIPVSRPERTILWLAGMNRHRYCEEIAIDRTAVALDQAWRQGLIDGHGIHDLAERSGGKGRSGIVVLRELLEQRPPDYRPAGSHLEERFETIVPYTVSKQLQRQVTVDAEVVIRTVDYRLRTWPLIAEINGEAFHTSLTDRAHDDERYERLLELGFSVVVFWEHDIWHDDQTVRSTMWDLFRTPDLAPTLHRPTLAPWDT